MSGCSGSARVGRACEPDPWILWYGLGMRTLSVAILLALTDTIPFYSVTDNDHDALVKLYKP